MLSALLAAIVVLFAIAIALLLTTRMQLHTRARESGATMQHLRAQLERADERAETWKEHSNRWRHAFMEERTARRTLQEQYTEFVSKVGARAINPVETVGGDVHFEDPLTVAQADRKAHEARTRKPDPDMVPLAFTAEKDVAPPHRVTDRDEDDGV